MTRFTKSPPELAHEFLGSRWELTETDGVDRLKLNASSWSSKVPRLWIVSQAGETGSRWRQVTPSDAKWHFWRVTVITWCNLCIRLVSCCYGSTISSVGLDNNVNSHSFQLHRLSTRLAEAARANAEAAREVFYARGPVTSRDQRWFWL